MGRKRLTKIQAGRRILARQKARARFRSGVRWRKKTPLALQKKAFCERSTTPTTLTVAPESSAVGMIKEFSLNEIAQTSSYQDLFEEYQINKVVASFRYKSTGQYAYDLQPGALQVINEINPVLYFKVDHNDETLETLADLKKSTKTRTFQFTNSKPNIDIVLKPACLVDVANIHGALGVAHRPKWKCWLPTEESAVSHFGLKAYVVGYANSTHNAGQVVVSYKIYFTCKNNE